MVEDWIKKLTPYRVTVAIITGLMLGYLLQVVLVIFSQWLIAPLLFLLVGACVILVFIVWMQHQPDLIQ